MMLQNLLLTLIYACFFVVSANAKIIDPPAVVEGKVTYKSHANYVEAFNTKTKKRLWMTIVYEDGYINKFNPQLEKDVQWNIINKIKSKGDFIYVQNKKGEEFLLDKINGKVKLN